MRQLKAFMKAKKGVCSKKCACLTINMWRCADLQGGEEFCGCDTNANSRMLSHAVEPTPAPKKRGRPKKVVEPVVEETEEETQDVITLDELNK